MGKGELTDKKLEGLVAEIEETNGETGSALRDKILEIIDLLFEVIFPGYTGKRAITKTNINFVVIDILCHIYTELSTQIERALKYRCRLENCDTGDCRRMAAAEHSRNAQGRRAGGL